MTVKDRVGAEHTRLSNMWEALGTMSRTPKQNQYISTTENDE